MSSKGEGLESRRVSREELKESKRTSGTNSNIILEQKASNKLKVADSAPNKTPDGLLNIEQKLTSIQNNEMSRNNSNNLPNLHRRN